MMDTKRRFSLSDEAPQPQAHEESSTLIVYNFCYHLACNFIRTYGQCTPECSWTVVFMTLCVCEFSSAVYPGSTSVSTMAFRRNGL